MSTLENFTVFECPGIGAGFENLPDPYLFRETQIIRRVHNEVPRLDHPSDITPLLLYGLEVEEGSDYVKGLFVASVIIAIFILTWFLLLAILACLGPKRVGLLSGRLLTLPSKSNHSNSSGDDKIHLLPANVYEKSDNYPAEPKTAPYPRRPRQSLKFVRGTVLFCSVGIFICCIIMITKGIQSLVHSHENAVAGITKAQELADEAVSMIDTLVGLANETATQSREMAMQLNTNFCPAVREELCPNLSKYLNSSNAEDATEQTGTDLQPLEEVCNFVNIPYADKVEALINAGTVDLIPESIIQTREDMLEVSKMLGNMEENSGKYNWAFAVAGTFAAILSVLCLLIAYGVVEAWCGCTQNRNCILRLFKYLRHWLLLPMFILFVTISWVFSMVFVIGSTAAADLCVDSPDDRVAAMVIKYGDFQGMNPMINSTGSVDFSNVDSESLMLLFLLYYIQGCPDDSSPQGLIDSITEVLTVLDETVALIASVVSDIDLPAICGSDPVDLLTSDDTNVFETTICNVGVALVELQKYFSCQNWRPLYRVVMYDAVCYNANDGFYYMTVTQFLIVIFAMIMLTCRVAFTQVDFDEDRDDNDSRELDGFDNTTFAMAESPAPNVDVATPETAPFDKDEQKIHLPWITPLEFDKDGDGNDDRTLKGLDNAAAVMVECPARKDIVTRRESAPFDEY